VHIKKNQIKLFDIADFLFVKYFDNYAVCSKKSICRMC